MQSTFKNGHDIAHSLFNTQEVDLNENNSGSSTESLLIPLCVLKYNATSGRFEQFTKSTFTESIDENQLYCVSGFWMSKKLNLKIKWLNNVIIYLNKKVLILFKGWKMMILKN